MEAKRRVGCARSAACHHHARAAGELGVGDCGKTGASLVAASHEIDLAAFVESVKERKKAFAGYAKCPVDTMRDQSDPRLDRQPEKPCDTIAVRGALPSRRKLYRVCEIPIQLPGTRIVGAGRELPVVDTDHRRDLGEITGRKDLVRGEEIGIAQRGLYHRDAFAAQEVDHPLPGNAVQEGAVRTQACRQHHLSP